MIQTIFDFTLPRGIVDSDGNVLRSGEMRLATAGDEIFSMRDSRAKENPEYARIMILSKVIISLERKPVTPEMLETLYVSDLQYLEQMYQIVNETGESDLVITCPHCGKAFHLPFDCKQKQS